MTRITEQDKRDLADGDWWRGICTILGATLVGWTFRQVATIRFKVGSMDDFVELDGRIAQTISHISEPKVIS